MLVIPQVSHQYTMIHISQLSVFLQYQIRLYNITQTQVMSQPAPNPKQNPNLKHVNNINIDPQQQSQNQQQASALTNYRIVGTLGSGTFGKVKSAIHVPSGQQVAVKIIDKKTLKDADDRERVQRQVQIMKCIRHPNIVQFYQKIQTLGCIYLVVQYAENGQLFKLMAQENRINQRAAGRIFIQLMNAVEYLHRLGIAHRDLKPQNILLDTDYNIKLIDFGLSNYSQKGEYLHTACGSPCYAPPQMVSGRSYQGQIGDLWSMGIIFYGMICGNLPFQQNTTKQLYKRVIEGVYHIPSYITLEATQVIRKLLVTNPVQRITIPQLRKLSFFKNLREVEPKIIGIIVGFHPMPIDSEIIQKMRKIIIGSSNKTNFNREQIQDQIKQNEHTQFTTLYYLLQKQSLRNGGKTAIDLQYFLQSSEKYKGEYGILPANFEREQSNETIKTVKNSNNSARNKYNISNTKGLSKQKRQPISISKKPKHEKLSNQTYRSEKPDILLEKQADNLLHTVKRYKLQKAARSQRNTQTKAESSGGGRSRHLKTMGSQQKQKQKSRERSNKSKQLNHHYSSSTSRKKSQKKMKTENTQKLALNLWNAYFQKPIQSSARYNKQGNSTQGLKLVKKQKQRQDKAFTQNLQRLKQGFLKLPFMKKSKNSDEGKTEQKVQHHTHYQNHQSEKSRNFSKKSPRTNI